jgi:hypothetical protein
MKLAALFIVGLVAPGLAAASQVLKRNADGLLWSMKNKAQSQSGSSYYSSLVAATAAVTVVNTLTTVVTVVLPDISTTITTDLTIVTTEVVTSTFFSDDPTVTASTETDTETDTATAAARRRGLVAWSDAAPPASLSSACSSLLNWTVRHIFPFTTVTLDTTAATSTPDSGPISHRDRHGNGYLRTGQHGLHVGHAAAHGDELRHSHRHRSQHDRGDNKRLPDE